MPNLEGCRFYMRLQQRVWILVCVSAIAFTFSTGFTVGGRMPACQGILTDTIPHTAQTLITAYPDFVKGYTNNHILLKDGAKLLWDDGIKKQIAPTTAGQARPERHVCSVLHHRRAKSHSTQKLRPWTDKKRSIFPENVWQQRNRSTQKPN